MSIRDCLQQTVPIILRGLGVFAVVLLCACSTGKGGNIANDTISPVAVEKNISYGAADRTLDIYSALKPVPGNPVVIFFPGGFWQAGKKEDYNFIGQTMAKRGITMVIADYRLYPQAVFPDFIEDGADAFAWTRKNIADYGGNPNRIFLMGHSAGAYIAAMLTLDPDYLAKDGLAPSNISGTIGIAGPYDFLPLSGKNYGKVFADASPGSTQPISYVSGKAPPMLLLSGDRDDQVDSANTLSLARHIQDKGGSVRVIVYPQTGHIGILLPFTPLFHGPSTIIDDVAAFIKG